MRVGLREQNKEGQKKPTRYYSNLQEKKVAKDLEGKKNLNSGATPFQKGDVTLDEWLLECKTKTSHADSISVKKEWLEKNKQEALFMNKKYSAVVINFGPNEENHYIIDQYLFEELVNYLKNRGEE